MVRVCSDDPSVEECPREVIAADVDHAVRPGSALRPTLAADTLDQHLDRRAHLLAHPFERDRFLERDEALEPLLDDGLVELSVHLGSTGPGPRRVLERVRLVEPRPPNHIERAPEVLLGLAGEPHDDVGAHGDVRDRGADPFEPAEVSLAPVRTLHRLQHAVRSRLEREVDVFAHLVALGHRVDHVGREVVRVRAGEPDPADAVDPVHRSEQIGEQRPARRVRDGEVASVRVHVLTEERHLDDALSREALDLGEHIADRTRELRPAHEGHDAESAGVVTSHRDPDPRVVRDLAEGGKGAREDLGLLADVELRPVRLGAAEQVEQLGQGVGADHDVDPRGALADRRAVHLGEAPRDHDPHPRVPLLQRPEVPEIAVQAVVRLLADRARVEHDDRGVRSVLGRDVAVRGEQPGDPLRVVLVHLAPEGAEEVAPIRHRLEGTPRTGGLRGRPHGWSR